MFLHVIAVDRQLTVFSEAEESLGELVDKAFAFHKVQRTGDMSAVTAQGRRLDLAKTPEANGLQDDELVTVRKLEPVAEPAAAVAPPEPAPAPSEPKRKGRKKTAVTAAPGPESPAPTIDWAALRRGRDLR